MIAATKPRGMRLQRWQEGRAAPRGTGELSNRAACPTLSGIMIQPEIKVLPDPQAIAAEAADRIARAADEAVALTGRFTLALSGGSTPKILYQLLADQYRDAIDWAHVQVFFGDERCVPPDHPESNYRMAHETLLSKVPIP